MTPEGKKLLSRAMMVLGGIVGVMLIIHLFSPAEKKVQTNSGYVNPITAMSGSLPDTEPTASPGDADNSTLNFSAIEGLVKLLHRRAYNNLQSNRVKSALYLWQVAHEIDPDIHVIELRLNEVKTLLDYKIRQNAAVGMQDEKALRFKRALQYYERAASYAEGVDDASFQKYTNAVHRLENKINQ